jgi:AAA+ ATPase superfamily predicted ATPase
MLFDPRPKTSKNDLYNFDVELKEIMKNIGKPMIVVSGLRRTGKTSLVLTALSEYNTPYLLIDLREGFQSYRDLYQLLSRSSSDFILRASRRERLKELFMRRIQKLRGVSIAGLSISFSWGKSRFLLTEFFDMLSDVGERIGEGIVIVLDEFQKSRGGIGLLLHNAIAYSYDYYRNLSFILTGSEMGVLYGILGNPENPLYGRAFIEIKTRKLKREESIEFLERGFRECRYEVSQAEIEKAVDQLNGIIGWLTHYGYLKISGRENFEEIKREAVELAKTELENFLKQRVSQRYRLVLKLLAEDIDEWSMLKRNIEKYEGKELSDRVLHEILQQLRKHSIINDENKFTDPILKEASRNI